MKYLLIFLFSLTTQAAVNPLSWLDEKIKLLESSTFEEREKAQKYILDRMNSSSFANTVISKIHLENLINQKPETARRVKALLKNFEFDANAYVKALDESVSEDENIKISNEFLETVTTRVDNQNLAYLASEAKKIKEEASSKPIQVTEEWLKDYFELIDKLEKTKMQILEVYVEEIKKIAEVKLIKLNSASVYPIKLTGIETPKDIIFKKLKSRYPADHFQADYEMKYKGKFYSLRLESYFPTMTMKLFLGGKQNNIKNKHFSNAIKKLNRLVVLPNNRSPENLDILNFDYLISIKHNPYGENSNKGFSIRLGDHQNFTFDLYAPAFNTSSDFLLWRALEMCYPTIELKEVTYKRQWIKTGY